MSALLDLSPVPDQDTPIKGMPPLRRAFAGTNDAQLHCVTVGTSRTAASNNPCWIAGRLIRFFGDQA